MEDISTLDTKIRALEAQIKKTSDSVEKSKREKELRLLQREYKKLIIQNSTQPSKASTVEDAIMIDVEEPAYAPLFKSKDKGKQQTSSSTGNTLIKHTPPLKTNKRQTKDISITPNATPVKSHQATINLT